MSPSINWGKHKISIEHKIINKDLEIKLKSMSMKELRDYVKQHNLKASDTKKSELITEILKELGFN